MNLNAVRTKVLCYDQSGQKPIKKHVDLIHLVGTLYYVLDGHSVTVFNHFKESVYCEIGVTAKSNLEIPERVQLYQTNAESYLDTLFKEEHNFIKLIDIELISMLGYPSDQIEFLKDKRNAFIKAREEKEIEERKEKERKAEEKKELERLNNINLANESLSNLRNDKYIDFKSLLNLCAHLNIDLHIRTKGFLMKDSNQVSDIKKGRGRFKKGTSRSTMDTLWKIIDQILEMEVEKI